MLGTGETVTPEELDRDLILQLCRVSPTVAAAMSFYGQGHLDYTQALILAVKTLNDQYTELQQTHMKSLQLRTVPNGFRYIPD